MTTTAAQAPAADDQGPPPSRRRRALIVGVVALLLVGVLAVVLAPGGDVRPRDPDSPAASGARALARVAADRGIEVRPVRSAAEVTGTTMDSGTTLLVSDASEMSQADLDAVREAGSGRLVLLTPSAAVLDDLGVPATPVGQAPRLAAGCDTDLARSDDTISAGGVSYRPTAEGVGTCFTVEQETTSAAVLLDVPAEAGRPRTVVVGQPGVLTNGEITRESHAALGLRLLGDDVVWFVPHPSPEAPPVQREAPQAPAWIGPALAIAGLTVVLLCLWRGRRLGPLVVEPLPVVVPANELTRSRARLYRAGDDPAFAAALLRDAAGLDLRRRLRLPADAPVDRLAAAVAEAVGEPPDTVAHTLTRPVADARSLDDLARELRRLRRKVHDT